MFQLETADESSGMSLCKSVNYELFESSSDKLITGLVLLAITKLALLMVISHWLTIGYKNAYHTDTCDLSLLVCHCS